MLTESTFVWPGSSSATRAAMLVVVAGLRGGQKVVLAVENGPRESTASWSAILRDLKQRGLR